MAKIKEVEAAKGVPYSTKNTVFVGYASEEYRAGYAIDPEKQPEEGQFLKEIVTNFKAVALGKDDGTIEEQFFQFFRWAIYRNAGEKLGEVDPNGQWFTIEARPDLGKISVGDSVIVFGHKLPIKITKLQFKHDFCLFRIVGPAQWAYEIRNIRSIHERLEDRQHKERILGDKIYGWLIGNGEKTLQQIAYHFGYDLMVDEGINSALAKGLIKMGTNQAGETAYYTAQ